MKFFKYFLAGVLIGTAALSCKKDNLKPIGNSSLTIVNAVVNSSGLVTNFDNLVTLKYFSTANQIGYGLFLEFSGYGNPIQISLTDISDTTHTVYSNKLTFADGSIHSLFLCGTLTSPDNFLTTDIVPYHPATDSVLGVRFVNLSPGSAPVSVDIAGGANGSEVSSLAYKSITSFKNYAATSNISNYIFEFRDVGSGNLLATYNLTGINKGDGTNTQTNTRRWKNFTIALKGSPGGNGTTPQGTFLINNY